VHTGPKPAKRRAVGLLPLGSHSIGGVFMTKIAGKVALVTGAPLDVDGGFNA